MATIITCFVLVGNFHVISKDIKMLLGSMQLGLVAILFVQMISELILSYVITYRKHKSTGEHL